MKATISYTFTDEEISYGYLDQQVKSQEAFLALGELSEWLRSGSKYRESPQSEVFEEVRAKFWEIIQGRELQDLVI